MLLGYLVAGEWEPERRVALLTVLALMASLWAMLEQLYFLVGTGFPGWMHRTAGPKRASAASDA